MENNYSREERTLLAEMLCLSEINSPSYKHLLKLITRAVMKWPKHLPSIVVQDVHAMLEPYECMPLYINDDNVLRKSIAQWRLKIGK